MASVVKKTLHLDLAEMLKEDKPAEEVRQKNKYIYILNTLRNFCLCWYDIRPFCNISFVVVHNFSMKIVEVFSGPIYFFGMFFMLLHF